MKKLILLCFLTSYLAIGLAGCPLHYEKNGVVDEKTSLSGAAVQFKNERDYYRKKGNAALLRCRYEAKDLPSKALPEKHDVYVDARNGNWLPVEEGRNYFYYCNPHPHPRREEHLSTREKLENCGFPVE